MAFEKDVTLIIPVGDLEPGLVPVVHTLNLAQKTFSQQRCVLELHPDTRTVELSVSHFSGLTAEQVDELKRAAEECSNPETACRCRGLRVEQQDAVRSCSDATTDCAVISSRGVITFASCTPSTRESYLFEEVSDGCKAAVSLVADAKLIEPGEQTGVTAKVVLGCSPLANQKVHFTATGAGTVPGGDGVSGHDGEAKTTLTAKEEAGTATVTGTVPAPNFYRDHIVVNDITVKAEWGSDAPVSAGVEVFISARPVLQLTADRANIKPHERALLTAQVTRNGVPLADQGVSFSVTGPAFLTSTSGTTAELTAQGETGTAVVKANCTTRVTTPSGEQVDYPLEAEVRITIADSPELWTGTWQGHTPNNSTLCAGASITATFDFRAFDASCAAEVPVPYNNPSTNLCGRGIATYELTPLTCNDGCTLISPLTGTVPFVVAGLAQRPRRLDLNFQAERCASYVVMKYRCGARDEERTGGCTGGAAAVMPLSPLQHLLDQLLWLRDGEDTATLSGGWDPFYSYNSGGGWTLTVSRKQATP